MQGYSILASSSRLLQTRDMHVISNGVAHGLGSKGTQAWSFFSSPCVSRRPLTSSLPISHLTQGSTCLMVAPVSIWWRNEWTTRVFCGFLITYEINSQLFQSWPLLLFSWPLFTSCLEFYIKLHRMKAHTDCVCQFHALFMLSLWSGMAVFLTCPSSTKLCPYLSVCPSHLSFPVSLTRVYLWGHWGMGLGGWPYCSQVSFFLQQLYITHSIPVWMSKSIH